MRKKIVAGNWKMNFSQREAKTYISKFPRYLKSGIEDKVIIFAQALLERGACMDTLDHKGTSPLMIALTEKKDDMISLFNAYKKNRITFD